MKTRQAISVVPSDRKRGNGHKVKYRKHYLNVRKKKTKKTPKTNLAQLVTPLLPF